MLGYRVDALEAKLDTLSTKIDAFQRDMRVQFYWTITLMVMLFGSFTAITTLT